MNETPLPQPPARGWVFHTARVLWIAMACALAVKFAFWPEPHSVYYPCYETGGRFWSAGEDMHSPRGLPRRFSLWSGGGHGPGALRGAATWLGGLLWIWLNLAVFFASLWALMRRILPGRWTRIARASTLDWCSWGPPEASGPGRATCSFSPWSPWPPRRSSKTAGGRPPGCWPSPSTSRRGPWRRACSCRPAARGRWPPGGACLLGVAAIPFLTKPFALVCQRYYGWFAVLTGRAAEDRHTYRDAWTIWEQFQTHVPYRLYLALQLATAAVVVGLCLWQARRRMPVQWLLLFVLVAWACWQLVFGPATERNTFGLLAPLTSWALITAFEEKRGRVLMSLAFVLTFSATFGVTERWSQTDFPRMAVQCLQLSGVAERWLQTVSSWAVLAHPIGTLLLAGWFLAWNARTGDEGLGIRD